MMPEKKFGKCDECGVIGPLEEISLTGNAVNAHFCVDCGKIFLNCPELSSFIAFQNNKPPQKNPEPVKAL
jgi:heterodisulfide reductase subunit A-like polyferredoxin